MSDALAQFDHVLVYGRPYKTVLEMLLLREEELVGKRVLDCPSGPDAFVAVAGYGDDGPWYIPVKEEYGKGGYELEVALCSPAVDDMLTAAMSELLAN